MYGEKVERNEKIRELRKSGVSYTDIASALNMRTQRVKQICERQKYQETLEKLPLYKFLMDACIAVGEHDSCDVRRIRNTSSKAFNVIVRSFNTSDIERLIDMRNSGYDFDELLTCRSVGIGIVEIIKAAVEIAAASDLSTCGTCEYFNKLPLEHEGLCRNCESGRRNTYEHLIKCEYYTKKAR